MSFPRYPKYKESGIEWVGVVPSHWRVEPLFGSVRECDEPNVGMKESNLLSLSYGRIVRKDMLSNDGLLPESFETYQIVRPGDIVLRLTDLQNDKRSLRSALVTELGIITSAYLAVRPTEADSRFLSYLLRAYDVTKVFYSMGGGLRQAMKFDDLKRLPVLLPSQGEQTGIADFLDCETAKIDALVAEQQRLIELLKEKRQAVISHAVTKGLNPDAPMKPSGIEWLGDVPAHWEVGSLRRISKRLVVGIAEAATHAYADVGIPILRSTNIRPGKIIGDILFIDPAFAGDRGTKQIQAGDLVTVRTGNAGVTAVIPKNLDGCQCFTMLITTLHKTYSADFYCYWMNSVQAQSYFSLEGWGTAQVNISVPILKDLPIPIPPHFEQGRIVDYLDSQLSRLDELSIEAERAIELLQERRTALISSAVTGQIDVRELVKKKEAA